MLQCNIHTISLHCCKILIMFVLTLKSGPVLVFIFARVGFNVFGNFGFNSLKITDFL